ncbi:putative metacaspase [Trifolium repens]|nr:putative metacaspase [Trifolium repens]
MKTSKKKKRAEMDVETSSSSLEKPKRRPMKKAVLVGLKPPAQMMMKMNSVDVKAQILRMKKHLMKQRGFPEDKIIVIIEDEEETKPTATNIRDQLYRLVECSNPGDILFIHLIAYGCSDGLIVTPDHKHIDDTYFRALIVRAVRLCLNLTFISDCLIQPIPRCPCPKTRSPVLTLEECLKKHREFWSKPDPLAQATYVTGYYGFVACTNLSHVHLQGEEEEEEYKTITQTQTCLPSRVILFTPFPCDHNVSPDNINDVSEVVYPPPTGHNHRPYGAFTNSILNVIEHTRGRVTNLELAQKAMIKLGGQTPPRLSCSHLNYARAPFVC